MNYLLRIKKIEHDQLFNLIYSENLWGSEESESGEGSSLDGTLNVRKSLPEIFRAYNVKSIFDAPCGDFSWMSQVVSRSQVTYVGGDIVLDLITKLQVENRLPNVEFLHFDLTRDTPPQVDLMICRDCLFHLSYEHGISVLKNFLDSGISYLLTTTHDINADGLQNKNIRTGGFRFINIFAPPYSLPSNYLLKIDDSAEGFPKKWLVLFHRSQFVGNSNSFPPHS